MNTPKTLTPEMMAELATNVRLCREVNYSHTCCDSRGSFLHFMTLYNGGRYITTPEQKAEAETQYKINQAFALQSIGNRLVFVGMGCDYTARYEDDVCNHRIRTEIINPEGRRFFIEVGTGRGENMRIDFVVDRDQEKEYEIKAAEYRQKIEDAGGFWKIGKGHPIYDKYQEYMSQPYYWYKKDLWFSLNVKYTRENVLKLVNKLFDCHFTEMEVDYCHLTTEMYSSISPVSHQ